MYECKHVSGHKCEGQAAVVQLFITKFEVSFGEEGLLWTGNRYLCMGRWTKMPLRGYSARIFTWNRDVSI